MLELLHFNSKYCKIIEFYRQILQNNRKYLQIPAKQ